MHYLKKLFEGLFWGIGFTLGLIVVFLSAEKLELSPNQNKKDVKKAETTVDFTKIKSQVKNIALREGKIIVSAMITNNNPFALDGVWMDAIVSHNKQPIEKCSHIYFKLQAGETKTVSIFCRNKWEEISEDMLSAVSVVDRAEVQK